MSKYCNVDKSLRIATMQPYDCLSIDTKQVLIKWKDFASQFAKQGIATDGLGDTGLGHVKYNLLVGGSGGVNERSLRILNDCTELEQYVGDNLVRIERGLIRMITSQAGMDSTFATARRVAIRAEIQR